MRLILSTLLLFSVLAHAYSQESTESTVSSRFLRGLESNVSASATIGSGDYSPLWLHSNRYGMESSEPNSCYLRVGLFRSMASDSSYQWRYGYGIDLAVSANHVSTFTVQQLYLDIGWKHGLLSIGSKERPMELKNNLLSSGSQTLGINSRPIPQVRLELPKYWTVPFTKGWLQFRGHISYGMMTDDHWQHDFTRKQSRYTNHVLYHTKAGYIRIKHEDYDYPLSFEGGLEMACQFGGTTYSFPNGVKQKIVNSKNVSSFFHALIPGGGEMSEHGTVYENTEGNNLGSYVLRLNYDKPRWGLGIYFERFFEDQSGMFGIDYDGYGKGDSWNHHKSNRWLVYDFKDMMVGVELELKRVRWLRHIVAEYLHTKYQSGPIYHDHNPGLSDHIGGNDNYYNHYVYPGWQHWGEAIGNPLYYSPLYSEDGSITFKNNRFMAFHLGLSGELSNELTYRFLASWEEGVGTYRSPFTSRLHQGTFLAEATYSPLSKKLAGWSCRVGVGLDVGSIIGDNFGCQLTVFRKIKIRD